MNNNLWKEKNELLNMLLNMEIDYNEFVKKNRKYIAIFNIEDELKEMNKIKNNHPLDSIEKENINIEYIKDLGTKLDNNEIDFDEYCNLLKKEYEIDEEFDHMYIESLNSIQSKETKIKIKKHRRKPKKK